MFKILMQNELFRLHDGQLLNTIRECSRKEHITLHNLSIKKDFYDLFYKTKFWKKDSGYKFIYKYLIPLLTNNTRIFDIGCSMGQLRLFLKHHGIKDDEINFYGSDINKESLSILREEFSEGEYEEADSQESLPFDKQQFDIVFSKGTICSTLYPVKTLSNILKTNTDQIMLVHNALTDKKLSAEGFITTIYSRENHSYFFTIMNKSFFINEIEKEGFKIVASKKRRTTLNIANFGTFYYYDCLLKRV